jgi:hypothetical protein
MLRLASGSITPPKITIPIPDPVTRATNIHIQHDPPQPLMFIPGWIPRPQKRLNPLLLTKAGPLALHPRQLPRRTLMGLIPHRKHTLGIALRPRGLADAAQGRENGNERDKRRIGQEYRFLALASSAPVRVEARVPLFPIFPCRVVHRAVWAVLGVFGAGSVRVAGPACAVHVVSCTFGWVGEDCVGGDDDSIAFEAIGSRDVSA